MTLEAPIELQDDQVAGRSATGPPIEAAPAPESDPIFDTARLVEIETHGLLEHWARGLLGPIAEEAATRTAAPGAMVSLVLPGRERVIAAHGLAGILGEYGESPLEWSFSVWTVRWGAPLVVEDATLEPLVSDSPLVEDGVRAYCGVPLLSASGRALASLCVIGPEARAFDADDLAVLAELSTRALAAVLGARARGAH